MPDLPNTPIPTDAPDRPHAPPPVPPRRRRRLAALLAGLALLLGALLWLGGREATLQALLRQIAAASGGHIALTGASGSLYGRIRLHQLRYRSKDLAVTADEVELAWSPLRLLSAGIAVSQLRMATLTIRDSGPSAPTTLPNALAPPLPISIADVRVGTLRLVDDGGTSSVGQIRLALSGDRHGWRLSQASARTAAGTVDADATLGGTRPFALDGTLSLSQSAAPAGRPAARLNATVRGDLTLLDIAATGQAGAARASARMTLAPLDPIILRSVAIDGDGIDPSGFAPGWPKAALRLRLAASIGPDQRVGGTLALSNEDAPGPLDRQRLPLRSVDAQLGGTLAAARLDAVRIDLGAAGQFAGGGSLARDGAHAGLGRARLALRTERLDLHAIDSQLHASRIAGDIGLDSAAGRHTLRAALAQGGLRLDLDAAMDAAQVQLTRARLQAGGGSVSLSGQLDLNDAQAFRAQASASHFNPAALGAYPAADLNADARLSGQAGGHWHVAADFALRPSRLFDQPLSGAGKLAADAGRVSAVGATLTLGQNRLDLSGGFGAPGQQLLWRAEAKQLAALRAGLSGAVSAHGSVEGTLAAPRGHVEADASALSLLPGKRARADSRLHLSGDVALTGPRRQPELTLAGSARQVDPAAFGPYPAGNIGADFSGSARLADDWKLAVKLLLQPSTLSGAALAGHVNLDADARRIANADIDLRLGANSVRARGGFGGAGDRLDWTLAAPQLASASPHLAGALSGAGTLGGSAAAPTLTAALDGKDLRLPGEQQLRSLRLRANLGAQALTLEADAAGYAAPALSLASARLQAGGTRAAHTLQLSARGEQIDAALRLSGGWDGAAWSGMVDTLRNRGRYGFALQAPAPLRLAGAPGGGIAGLLRPEQIALTNATLTLADGSVALHSLQKDGAQWRSGGQARGVPLRYLAQWSPGLSDTLRGDLTLGADWTVSVQAAADPALDGTLHVFREKGDLSVGADLPLALGLRQLDARAAVANNTLRTQLALDGARAGSAKLEASTQMIGGRIANDSALTLNGSVDMASLAWLAPLAGQPGLTLDGALKVALRGSGSIGEPVLDGSVQGDKLMLNWADQGLKLGNGQLRATLSGDRLLVQQLRMEGGGGHAQADGWLRFANADTTLQLKLSADKLQVLARPDRRLVISGQSTLVRDQKHFELDGKFKADRASIELAAQDTPTLSDDVVILGRSAPAGKPSAPSLPLTIDIEADLGDAFYLKGQGLDAQLGGMLRLRATDRRPPRINGSVHVVAGTYAAYGQKLSIERGLINFTGAYDNPGLNIQALRKRPAGDPLSETNVEAGVEVRGTALAPTAKLVSTPSVPDSDKLAWLVLGHGADAAGGDETALLATAASALLGSAGGGVQTRLANALGLDEVGVGQSTNAQSATAATGAGATSAKGLENTVLTVGKRLSQKAYLNFEQGASAASSLVKLRYKINPRITLQFQTGANTAFDVLYTWAFD